MRHLSPLQCLFRTATADSEIEGHALRADHKVMVCLAAANRDPGRWIDPDRFDLHRNASGHLGFGWGVHICLGMHIARLEAECLLSAFARRVRSFELAGPPEYRLNNTVRSLARLPISIVRERA